MEYDLKSTDRHQRWPSGGKEVSKGKSFFLAILACLLLVLGGKRQESPLPTSKEPTPTQLLQVALATRTESPAVASVAVRSRPIGAVAKEPTPERFFRLEPTATPQEEFSVPATMPEAVLEPAPTTPEEFPTPTAIPEEVQDQPDEGRLRYASYAGAGMEALLGWYDDGAGLWRDTGWWNSANALTAIADYALLSGDDRAGSIIANTFDKNSSGNFINDFYDDEGWWALAWVKAYDLTGDSRYLGAAEVIFQDMQGGWDSACNGGIWWSKERNYKNAIANELFIAVAAQLYLRTPPDRAPGYLAWAQQGWDWFRASGLINGANLVNDGLTASCENNGQPAWSYNQGVILGALLDLYSGTGDGSLLDQAVAIADAALANLAGGDGILRELCEPRGVDDADQPQFKGAFIRNLARLYEATNKPEYKDVILRNADSLWLNSRDPAGNYFGGRWDGPFSSGSPSKQGAALDALNAALGVNGQ